MNRTYRASAIGWIAGVLLLVAGGLLPATARGHLEQHEGAIANGGLPKRYISVGTTEDKFAIKISPGIVLSISATNTNAAARYIKCYDATAAGTTVGTTTPFISQAIPPLAAAAPLHLTFPSGARFDVALTCALVTGAADNDVTEVAANEVQYFITYK